MRKALNISHSSSETPCLLSSTHNAGDDLDRVKPLMRNYTHDLACIETMKDRKPGCISPLVPSALQPGRKNLGVPLRPGNVVTRSLCRKNTTRVKRKYTPRSTQHQLSRTIAEFILCTARTTHSHQA